MMTVFRVLILFLFAFPSLAQAQNVREYVAPTMANLSNLYWNFDKMDMNNDTHIDNYMLINRCDLYQETLSNEFARRKARAEIREFLGMPGIQFPKRFSFVQQLYVDGYDFERGGFKVASPYRIEAIRKFELLASDFNHKICDREGDLEGYAKGLVIELGRPLNLDLIPLSEDKAQRYAAQKQANYDRLSDINKRRTQHYRDVYLVMNVRMLEHQGNALTSKRFSIANMRSVLESVAVYADREKTNLLYIKQLR